MNKIYLLLQELRTEIDCRIQHGANSNGHLEAVLVRLDPIMKQFWEELELIETKEDDE